MPIGLVTGWSIPVLTGLYNVIISHAMMIKGITDIGGGTVLLLVSLK